MENAERMSARQPNYFKHDGSTSCLWQGCQVENLESSEALYAHVEAAHVAAPYVCRWGDCEYSGGQHKNDFRRHLCVHTGQRRYICQLCPAAFHRGFNLKMHMRRHNQEKPFGCTVCHARFAHKCALRTHTFLHTRERPYTCSACDAAFASSGQLSRHTLRKHKGPWCLTCGEWYVPATGMICGRCNMHSTFGAKERRFFEYVYNFDSRLAECCFTLRDQALGCGVLKRPDALMQLQANKVTKAAYVQIESGVETLLREDNYSIKLILEADEYYHAAYDPSCELARLQAIQERDNDALYVLRYNLDQPGAFDDCTLKQFCERVLAVLNGEFVKAIESPTLFIIEYFGYPEKRQDLLDAEFIRQCTTE